MLKEIEKQLLDQQTMLHIDLDALLPESSSDEEVPQPRKQIKPKEKLIVESYRLDEEEKIGFDGNDTDQFTGQQSNDEEQISKQLT